MAKSKNHSTHHQSRKDHRNGIIRPKVFPERNTTGMNQKYRRNLRHVRAGNQKRATALKATLQKITDARVAKRTKVSVARKAALAKNAELHRVAVLRRQALRKPNQVKKGLPQPAYDRAKLLAAFEAKIAKQKAQAEEKAKKGDNQEEEEVAVAPKIRFDPKYCSQAMNPAGPTGPRHSIVKARKAKNVAIRNKYLKANGLGRRTVRKTVKDPKLRAAKLKAFKARVVAKKAKHAERTKKTLANKKAKRAAKKEGKK